MNYSTAVFLINKNMRAVLALYEPEDDDVKHKVALGYKASKKTMLKTLDASIKVGDYVVVPTGTRHGMTVVKITDVDVNVDFDDTTVVNWVICKVDRTEHEKLLADESIAVDAMKKAEFRKRRNALFDAINDDRDELRSLPMYADKDSETITG